MRSKILSIVSCTTIIFFLQACSKDNEQNILVQQPSTCDTINMQYTKNILPILQANCYSCHGNGSTGGSGGISLDGYINLQKWVANGYLLGNISYAPGFVGMPVGQPKLSSCDINKVVSWINHGYQNN
jgi:hypothetical protein